MPGSKPTSTARAVANSWSPSRTAAHSSYEDRPILTTHELTCTGSSRNSIGRW